MPLLHGKTKVFIDFEGMLYDTDTYVVKALRDIVLAIPDKLTIFESLKTLYDDISENNLKYYLQFKAFENPLTSFVTMDYEIEDDDFDLYEYLDNVYADILYSYKSPTEEEDVDNIKVNRLIMTSIGNGIRHLINDSNFAELYIYSKRPLNNDIIELIGLDLDLSDNIIFLTGDKRKAMVENIADYYFLNNLYELYYIATKHYDDEINFLVPAFSYNMMDSDIDEEFDDDDEDQVQLLNLEENAIITKRKYNIEVCYTTIPIL